MFSQMSIEDVVEKVRHSAVMLGDGQENEHLRCLMQFPIRSDMVGRASVEGAHALALSQNKYGS